MILRDLLDRLLYWIFVDQWCRVGLHGEYRGADGDTFFYSCSLCNKHWTRDRRELAKLRSWGSP